jgi:transposase
VVDSVAQLDLSALYANSGTRGGDPYAPEVLLGLLLYGYATGVFSSRKIERATYEAVPFRFIAGNLHPDHDTLATFRRTFLPELKDLFVQVLLLAQEAGVLKLGTISLDGTKVHADARHSQSGELPAPAGVGDPAASGGRGPLCGFANKASSRRYPMGW